MSYDIIFQKAVELHQTGRLEEAEHLYRQILETAPTHAETLHLLGNIAIRKHLFSEAVELIYKAIASSESEQEHYYFSLGLALQEWGKKLEAIEKYKKALELNPNMFEAYNNIGNIYRAKGNITEAQKHFWKSLEINQNYSEAKTNLALTYLDNGDKNRARDYLKEIIASDDNCAEAHFQYANIIRSNDIDKAIYHYQKAIKLVDDYPLFYNSLGIAYEEKGELQKALDSYEQALSLDNTYIEPMVNSGNIYNALGDIKTAEKIYRRAVYLDPQNALAHNNLGNVLQKQELFQEALECYRSAIIINPKMAEASNNIGLIVKAFGDKEEALGLFFNALSINPNLIDTHHNIAETLYEIYVDEDAEKATKIAENWLKAYPDNKVAEHVLSSFTSDSDAKIDRASQEFVENYFDAFADNFESKLAKLEYQTPQKIADIITNNHQGKFNNILDLGCGTGLSGAALHNLGANLDGVDLSTDMLKIASDKNIYRELYHNDIISFLKNSNNQYDLMVAADVCCYFGNLSKFIDEAALKLAPQGYLCFSVEKDDDTNLNGFSLKACGRFKHTNKYVTDLLIKAKLEIASETCTTLRQERDKPVIGTIFLAKLLV